ncbi:hypothetical protein HPB50_005205 [Hyalomma asiaticum]|uniref:Uncharacterized protein n=1 Tax=Hyalomma asiaticum TaxID=266040 RepID=A0ACB7S704_HYAAI|nr:hypothetical protein HPB50_005205 [Hyalomma asiaticum]
MHLSPEVAQEVADVIAAPLNDAPYQHLKQSILDRTTTSESARLRHLLTSEELGDRRPSQLLNSMRQLLRSSDVDSNGALFRELFLQRLPQSTHLVLAAAGDLTLDRLAQLADRVHDMTSATVAALSSTPESSVVSRLESRIDQLAASIDALRTSPHDHRGVSTRQGHRASSPSSPRSRSPRGLARVRPQRGRPGELDIMSLPLEHQSRLSDTSVGVKCPPNSGDSKKFNGGPSRTRTTRPTKNAKDGTPRGGASPDLEQAILAKTVIAMLVLHLSICYIELITQEQ